MPGAVAGVMVYQLASGEYERTGKGNAYGYEHAHTRTRWVFGIHIL